MKRMLTRSVCLALSFLVALAVAERLSGWRGQALVVAPPPTPTLTTIAGSFIRRLPLPAPLRVTNSRVSITGTVPVRDRLIACIVVNPEDSEIWTTHKVPTFDNASGASWSISETIALPPLGARRSRFYKVALWTEWLKKGASRGQFCRENATIQTGNLPKEISSSGFATVELRR